MSSRLWHQRALARYQIEAEVSLASKEWFESQLVLCFFYGSQHEQADIFQVENKETDPWRW